MVAALSASALNANEALCWRQAVNVQSKVEISNKQQQQQQTRHLEHDNIGSVTAHCSEGLLFEKSARVKVTRGSGSVEIIRG